MSGIEDILRQVMAGHDPERRPCQTCSAPSRPRPGVPAGAGSGPACSCPWPPQPRSPAWSPPLWLSVPRSTATPARLAQARPRGPTPPRRRCIQHRCVPAALDQVPRYFAELALTGPVQVIGGEAVAVRSTLTGHVLATVTPPRPYQIFTWVSAASDRTFVLAAQRYWPIASGQAGMPPRTGTSPPPRCSSSWPSTRPLTRPSWPASPSRKRSPPAQLAGMTVSPDGTRLALDLGQSIQVVTLATGAVRSWAWPGGGGSATGEQCPSRF